MLAPILVVTALVAFFPPDGNERADWVQFIGRFHPLLVHFPIALFLLVPILEMVGRCARFAYLHLSASFVLALATLRATTAALLGWCMGRSGGYSGMLITQHMWGGVVLSLVCWVCWLLRTWLPDLSLIGSPQESDGTRDFWGFDLRGKPVAAAVLAGGMLESRVLCGISKHSGNGGKVGGWTFPRFPLRVISSAKLWILGILARMPPLGTSEGLIGHFSKPRQMHIFPDSCGEPLNLRSRAGAGSWNRCINRLPRRAIVTRSESPHRAHAERAA
jgi:hypothetical protein